jgi:hypothetical protein
MGSYATIKNAYNKYMNSKTSTEDRKGDGWIINVEEKQLIKNLVKYS